MLSPPKGDGTGGRLLIIYCIVYFVFILFSALYAVVGDCFVFRYTQRVQRALGAREVPTPSGRHSGLGDGATTT